MCHAGEFWWDQYTTLPSVRMLWSLRWRRLSTTAATCPLSTPTLTTTVVTLQSCRWQNLCSSQVSFHTNQQVIGSPAHSETSVAKILLCINSNQTSQMFWLAVVIHIHFWFRQKNDLMTLWIKVSIKCYCKCHVGFLCCVLKAFQYKSIFIKECMQKGNSSV